MKQTYIVEVDDITGKINGTWHAEAMKRCGEPLPGAYSAQEKCVDADVYALLSPNNGKALSIGQKVLEAADGMKIHCVKPFTDCIPPSIKVYLEPAPLTGLAWLKSLPVGTRLYNGQCKASKFMVTKERLA